MQAVIQSGGGYPIASPPRSGADSLIRSTAPTGMALAPDGLTRQSLPSAPQPATDAALTRQFAAVPQKPETTGGAKAAKSVAPHPTEFYSMEGQLLGSFMNTSPHLRVMVDEEAYGEYLEAKFATLDLDAPDVATAFVTGVVDALNREEAATKTDLIAKESKQVLAFTGKATDKAMGGKNRQLGEGTLDVVAQFDNGNEAEVASFEAVSGPMNNGLIPNGRYKAHAPVDASHQFPDETGKWGFKMVLDPQQKMSRSDFRIHSVQERKPYYAWMTEGCVGLSGGHDENVRFHALMQAYFKTHKSIELTVDIDGNANVKTQLGDKPDYPKPAPAMAMEAGKTAPSPVITPRAELPKLEMLTLAPRKLAPLKVEMPKLELPNVTLPAAGVP